MCSAHKNTEHKCVPNTWNTEHKVFRTLGTLNTKSVPVFRTQNTNVFWVPDHRTQVFCVPVFLITLCSVFQVFCVPQRLCSLDPREVLLQSLLPLRKTL